MSSSEIHEDLSLDAFRSLIRENPRVWGAPDAPAYEAWEVRAYREWRNHNVARRLDALGDQLRGEWAAPLAADAYEWLIPGLMPARAYNLIYGQHGAGKSYTILDLALSAALGLPFMGVPVPARFGSIIFVGEKEQGLWRRVHAWLTSHGCAHERPPVLIVPWSPDLTDRASVGRAIARVRLAREEFRERGVDLKAVFFDTLAMAIPGKSVSDPATATAAIAALKQIVRATGVAAIPVAHVAKQFMTKEATAKGAGEWEDAAEAILRVEANSSGARRVVNTKQSDGPRHPPLHFTLEPVEIGIDSAGCPATACVVRGVDPATSSSQRRGPDDGLVAKTVVAMLADAGQAQDQAVPLRELRERLVAGGFRAQKRPDGNDPLKLRAWSESTRKALDRLVFRLARDGQLHIEGDLIRLPASDA